MAQEGLCPLAVKRRSGVFIVLMDPLSGVNRKTYGRITTEIANAIAVHTIKDGNVPSQNPSVILSQISPTYQAQRGAAAAPR